MSNRAIVLDPEELQAKLESCQQKIGYRFRDPGILQASLTHASGASSRLGSNERMEFLGDSVLGFVVCEHLYQRYPEYSEGDLTKIKSIVVSRRVCAKISRELSLEECLILGKGLMTGNGVPRSLLSDVFEAIVAGVHLDGGLDAAKPFVLRFVEPEIFAAIEGYTGGNYKSALQQLVQREMGIAPIYELMSERGPDHSKSFEVAVRLGERLFPSGWGRSKKEAQQRAANHALTALLNEDP
jgi:ribonuclease III